MTFMIFFGKVMRCRKEKKTKSVLIMLLCDREEYKNTNNTAESNHNREDYGSSPTNYKMSDTDSGKSSASSKTTFGDSATSTTKEVC